MTLGYLQINIIPNVIFRLNTDHLFSARTASGLTRGGQGGRVAHPWKVWDKSLEEERGEKGREWEKRGGTWEKRD